MPDLSTIKDLTLPSIAFLAGSIILVIAIVRRIEIRDIRVDLSKLQSVMLGVLGLLFIAFSMYSYFVTSQSKITPPNPSGPPPSLTTDYQIPSNIVQHFDFEQPIDKSITLGAITLGVCNNSLPTSWYDNCDEKATIKLKWQEDGYTDLHSLGCITEALPNKEQVYTIRWRFQSPLVADIVSAQVYVPDGSLIYLINLAAWTQGGEHWKVTGLSLSPNSSGWQQILLDLQSFIDENGKPANENGIIELHIDVFLSKATQQAKETVVKIDDIFFFYPASKPYPTPPLISTPAP